IKPLGRGLARSSAICTLALALLGGEANTTPPLTVPPGFVVERAAGPPLVERPMMAGLDERGRLFVCDSSGFNLLQGTSEVLVKKPPHRIRLLHDMDGHARVDPARVL